LKIAMDAIFKALADPTRRDLLDRLRQRDGQTLTELESELNMTRFGVMKHLDVLEGANLVVTRKVGRFKYHYLNTAPVQELVDRWIEPITRQPMTRAILDLKSTLEGDTQMPSKQKPDFVLETFIRATPEKIWEALTKGEMSRHYYIAGAAIKGTIASGNAYEYLTPDGNVMLSGEIIEANPHSRLEMTFVPGWGSKAASRNVYEIAQQGELSKLTIIHFGLHAGQEGVREGWAKIAASLKSFLETGKALTFTSGAAA
jgi:DNA-binding transcriptional ArsR family regulator/uncharacterized protein YndB with AHSA1/START domain